MTQVSADVRIRLDADNIFFIENTLVGSLAASDFDFI